MDRRKKIYVISAILLAVAVLIATGILVYRAGRRAGLEGPGGNMAIGPAETNAAVTRAAVPDGITVPEVNAMVSEDVAAPAKVVPTADGSELAYRSFDVRIDQGKFQPSSVILYAGDVARISFTAVDRDYDLVQPDNGYRLKILKGRSRGLEGQFPMPGKFTVYCESCGGPVDGFLGYIIVVPRDR
jgi:hypothetical protein